MRQSMKPPLSRLAKRSAANYTGELVIEEDHAATVYGPARIVGRVIRSTGEWAFTYYRALDYVTVNPSSENVQALIRRRLGRDPCNSID